MTAYQYSGNYIGRVRVPSRSLTTVPAAGQQFGNLRLIGAPWFTLSLERGVSNGEIVIATSEFDSSGGAPGYVYGDCPVELGDEVVFEPENGVEWARLRIQRIERRRWSWVCHLEGDSTDWMQPALEADSEAVDFTGETPGEVLTTLLNTGALSYYDSNGAHAREWHGQRYIDVAGDDVDGYRVDEHATCMDVIADLAALRQGDGERWVAWGVSNGMGVPGRNGYRATYFMLVPDTKQMRLARDTSNTTTLGSGNVACSLLNWPSSTAGVFWNAVEIVGDNLRVVERDEDSIEAQGGQVRTLRRDVPQMTSEADARRMARALLRRYADPGEAYEPVLVTIPSASALPIPWAGYCEVDQAGTNAKLPILHVRVLMGDQPQAEITIGAVEWGGNPFTGRGGRTGPGKPYDNARNQERRASGGSGATSSGDVVQLFDHSHNGDGAYLP